MYLLLNKNPKFIDYLKDDNLGLLLTPLVSIPKEDTKDYLTAIDNGAFSGFNETKFYKTLELYKDINPKFVVLPDVVADHKQTLDLYNKYKHLEKSFNTAFVLQDGLIEKEIPTNVSAIFIGGTTEFKLSKQVRKVVKSALKQDLWVHIGRVNSQKRIRYALDIGCNSFDGSGYAKFPYKLYRDLGYLNMLLQPTLL